MRILHINTLDGGGAANACLRIHQSLKDIGLESKVLVLHKTLSNNDVHSFSEYIELNKVSHLFSRLKKILRTSIIKKFYKNHERSGYFALLDSYYDILQHPLVEWADIINLHWIGDFVDYPSFFKNIKKPIVWTCHDMNPLTGGCHYFGACNKYKSDCNQCPLLDNQYKSIAFSNFRRKKIFLNKVSDICFVANSSWVKKALNQSYLSRGFKHEIIHYPILLEDFFVVNKVQARTQLEIKEKKVILFVAQNIGTKTKGFKYLVEAVKILNDRYPDLLLLAVGKGSNTDFEGLINYIHYDYVESISKLRAIYNATDVFVIPSIDEAFGQTCLEAMACGAPVVGFESGGIPDMINHGENGFLVNKGNIKKLAEAIEYILNNTTAAEKMGKKSVEIATTKFVPEKQAGKYMRIYEKLLC